jgi:hypothetical protein
MRKLFAVILLVVLLAWSEGATYNHSPPLAYTVMIAPNYSVEVTATRCDTKAHKAIDGPTQLTVTCWWDSSKVFEGWALFFMLADNQV